MAPLDFKHFTSARYRPGEDDAINYYAQKRKKQYHGNEGKDVKELSMKPDKKLPNLKVPVKGKKGQSKFMRKQLITKAKDDINASVQSADRKPEKYMKPDGKVGIRMVKTDKEVVKKEQMQVFRVGHKDMSGNVHATDPDDAMKKLRKKGLKGDIKLTHRGSVKSMPKRRIPTREELDSKDKPFVKKLIGKLRKGSNTHAKQADDLEKAMKTEVSVLKPTKPTDIIKHAKTLAKNPRDYMMNKKKYLDKARAKVFRMYPKEAINHDDAHRDAQTHSDGSMSVKKIPSMIKKPGDKHLHLHMKSYHKEKDGKDFAKKHGYKVKNYVKTQSGTRMDIHKEMVDPMDLRGRPTKKDPYHGKTKFGLKHPLHPLNIQKRKEKEAKKAAVKREAVEYPHMMYDPKTGNEVKAKTPADHNKYAKMGYTHEKPKVDEAIKNLSSADQVKAAIKIIRDKRFNMKSQIDKKTAIQKISKDLLKDPKVKKEMDKIYEENVEEALTLQQRMKRSRLMKRMKTRIKIGRERAKRKMANKDKLLRRARRQARDQIARKLTRGIPKKELTFARKKEIEKRLEKPALQARINRIAKRMFKDVRKAEVQRKKG